MPPLPLAALADAFQEQYTLTRELGRGGMATVYLARDRKHGRDVALKVLSPEIASGVGGERFLREIGIAASLSHPHILPLHDSGEVVVREPGGRAGAVTLLYYVMPYVQGETLRARLDREGQLPVAVAVALARQIAAALQHAHARGVIHRDIKPENILIDDGEAVVADFGIARAIELAGGARLTSTGVVVGTPLYMSPEQALGGERVDARTDVYALGCVLYEMLAGEPPFTGPTAQAIVARRLTEAPPPVTRSRETVPASLERVVARALARAPADRFASAGELADALGRAENPDPADRVAVAEPRGRPRARAPLVLGLAAVVALALTAAGLIRRAGGAPALDASLVAVTPFENFDPRADLWREGIMDLLSRGLDGAGPLRTVSPTVVMRRWGGRAEPVTAAELGRRTGAALVVFGAITPAGGDSVRLRASLLDSRTGRPVHEVEVTELASRIDRAADSLTFRLLRELGRDRPLSLPRQVVHGTTSLTALKAFLQGEQHLRRTSWDSALVAYERAIAADSLFARALGRAANVIGWTRTGFDSLAGSYAARAAANIRNLPVRDSLMLTVDSLMYSLLAAGPFALGADAEWWPRLRRLFALVEATTRRYPDDPEVWYQAGEVQTHLGPWLGRPVTDGLAAFERVIALDSAFGPAYIHAIEFGPLVDEAMAARRLRAYAALGSTDRFGEAARFALLLVDRTPAAAQLSVDTVSSETLIPLGTLLAFWPDSGHTATRVHGILANRPGPLPPAPEDPLFYRWVTVRGLLVHGRLAAAAELLPAEPHPVFYEAAAFGAPSPPTADSVLRPMVDGPAIEPAAWTLRWWAARQDTAMLRVAVRRGDAVAADISDPVQRQRGEYLARAARAYSALVRRDTALALARFLALPDSLCPACYFERLTRADLLVATGRDDEAAVLLQGDLPLTTLSVFPSQQLWMLLRARVAERRGDRETAVATYGWLARMWRGHDRDAPAFFDAPRDALVRLTDEP